MTVGGLQPGGVQFGSADGFAVSQSNRAGATLHFAYAPGSKGCARFAAKHLYMATVRCATCPAHLPQDTNQFYGHLVWCRKWW